MSVVQSVIPITAALIIVAEFTHLVELITAERPPPRAGGVAFVDGTQ
jgi:hypothetical protein